MAEPQKQGHLLRWKWAMVEPAMEEIGDVGSTKVGKKGRKEAERLWREIIRKQGSMLRFECVLGKITMTRGAIGANRSK